MDDLIIPSRTEEEGVNKLCEVLSIASEHGLNSLNWKNIVFSRKESNI